MMNQFILKVAALGSYVAPPLRPTPSMRRALSSVLSLGSSAWRSETLRNFCAALRRGDLRATSAWVMHALHLLRTGHSKGAALAGGSGLSSQERSAWATSNRQLKRARSLLKQWQLPEALAAARASVTAFPCNSAAHQVMAFIHEVMGDLAAAHEAARQAWRADPLSAHAVKLLRKYGLQDELATAQAAIAPTLEARRWGRDAVQGAIACLFELGKIEATLELLDEVDRRRSISDWNERTLLRADTLLRARQFRKAAALYDAVSDHRAYRYRALIGRAECHFELGKFSAAEADAVAAFKGLPSSQPRGFSNVLYHARFQDGRVREAFLESRHRPFTLALQQDAQGRYVQTLDELRTASDVVLVADYGVGDEIRFASIYPEVSDHLPQVTATCDPRLQTLFARSFPEMRFLPVERWREESVTRNPASRAGLHSQRLTPHVDTAALQLIQAAGAFTSIFDLLAELRRGHGDFGRREAYLVPDPLLLDKWRARIVEGSVPGRPIVALCWRSLLQDVRRNIHYLGVADLAPLGRVPATYWIVQPRCGDDELDALRRLLPEVRVLDGLDLVDDFEGQAAALSCMDAVITPHTTTGELAGALGVRTLMFGRTEGAGARLRPDGGDIWHSSVRGVMATPVGDPRATAEKVATSLAGLFRTP